jgi:hypothetical protein
MNKKYSNKTIVFIILICFILGNLTAYASAESGYGYNIGAYLRAIFHISTSDFYDNIDQKAMESREKIDQLFDSYIDTATDQVINNTDQYLKEEENRFDSEINAYSDEFMAEIDGIIGDKEEELRDILTDYVNQKIANTKEQIKERFEDELQRHLMELTEQ